MGWERRSWGEGDRIGLEGVWGGRREVSGKVRVGIELRLVDS